MRRICFFGLGCALAGGLGAAPLAAQEFTTMGGVMGSPSAHQWSYSWQLDYRYRFHEHFAWSAAWINEGHTTSHHRDGLALQAWAIVLSQPEEFSLAFGAGSYHYADTHLLPGDGYANNHGWTPILSLSATYYTASPWFARLTINHIEKAEGIESNTLVLGAGYQFGWHKLDRAQLAARPRSANVISALAGRSIVNSRSSEQATAVVVEYRRALGTHYDWTISWINEGDPKILHREGAASQLWLVDSHPERRTGIGLGLGPYYCFQRKGPPSPSAERTNGFAVLVSPTFSYRVAQHWQARITWNRVISPDDRDADVIVLGVGYRWGG